MKAILRSRGSNNDHQQYVENKAGCIQITESSPDTIGPTVIHWLIVNGVTRAGSRIRSHHNRPTINIWRAVRGGVGAYFTHPDHPSGLLCWNFHFVKDRKFEIEARNCIWVKSFSPPLGSSASQGRDMSGGEEVVDVWKSNGKETEIWTWLTWKNIKQSECHSRESDFYIERPSQRRNKIRQKLDDQILLCLISLKKEKRCEKMLCYTKNLEEFTGYVLLTYFFLFLDHGNEIQV